LARTKYFEQEFISLKQQKTQNPSQTGHGCDEQKIAQHLLKQKGARTS
jgi:hypothetical protein